MTNARPLTCLIFASWFLWNLTPLQSASTLAIPAGLVQDDQAQDEPESFSKPDEDWDSQTSERLPFLSGFVRAQESSVISELERIRTAIGLPVDFVRDAAHAVSEPTKKFGLELEKQSSNYSELRFNSQIHPELATRLYIQAREFVPHEQRPAYDSLITDVEVLQKINDNYAQQGWISYLDSVLRLNQKQKSELKRLVAENWDRRWNSLVSMTMFNSITFSKLIVDHLQEDRLSSILTAKQLSVYKHFQDFETANVLGNIVRDVKSGSWDDQEFKATCWKILDLEIQRVEQISPLTDKDLRLLRIAGKGCIQRLRNTWVRQIQSDSSNGRDAHAGIDAYHRTLNEFLTDNEIWDGAVAKVLDSQQIDSLERLESDQTKAIQEEIYQHAANVVSKASGIPLTLRQHQDLVAAFQKDSRPFESKTKLRRHYKLPYTLSDERFQEIIPARTWIRVKGLVHKFRKEIETVE